MKRLLIIVVLLAGCGSAHHAPKATTTTQNQYPVVCPDGMHHAFDNVHLQCAYDAS